MELGFTVLNSTFHARDLDGERGGEGEAFEQDLFAAPFGQDVLARPQGFDAEAFRELRQLDDAVVRVYRVPVLELAEPPLRQDQSGFHVAPREPWGAGALRAARSTPS